ncbi:hypothetical protein BDZ45DRAFT_736192 [Acephala macrosclerotiorum]|nr:hypothetical protein BDZ45DRAFT_736192 [Acephala macrosclerotiorum]
MSFGFSIGDFIAVIELANKIRTSSTHRASSRLFLTKRERQGCLSFNAAEIAPSLFKLCFQNKEGKDDGLPIRPEWSAPERVADLLSSSRDSFILHLSKRSSRFVARSPNTLLGSYFFGVAGCRFTLWTIASRARLPNNKLTPCPMLSPKVSAIPSDISGLITSLSSPRLPER